MLGCTLIARGPWLIQRARTPVAVQLELGEDPLEQARLATEASLAAAEAEAVAVAAASRAFDVRNLAGISAPLGFWDPANLCEGRNEGTIRFWREVEIKHGRVAMCATATF